MPKTYTGESKMNELYSYHLTCTEFNIKYIKDLSVRPKILKLLEENKTTSLGTADPHKDPAFLFNLSRCVPCQYLETPSTSK